MSHLFSPFALGPLALDNRIVVAPMCQYSCVDGIAAEWHLMHLGQMAISGAALLMIEATAVEPEGRITPGDLGLWSPAHEAALARTIAAIRPHADIRWGLQLAHAGRKGSSREPWNDGGLILPGAGGWSPLAPSAIPLKLDEPPPTAATLDELTRLRNAFADAAQRACRAGVELIEIHCAHGYLLHEFLSPLSNARQDAYGGSLAGRMRFPLEVFRAVREAVPASVPVGMRLSCTDWVEGQGWNLDQSIEFGHALAREGCAFLHASSGGLVPQQQIAIGPGYQVPFAEALRRETGLPTIAVGLIREPRQAEDILAAGQADLVALARGLIYNPRWPWHAAAELGDSLKVPPQYWRSQPQGLGKLFSGALVGMR